ncbi:hypothetical protein GmHk_05G012724 [Glycine max]|nr:hypothetical protein GmHk_05G012724 [Glycine max]
MGTPPRSPLPYSDCQSKATSMRSRQSARLRRTLDQPKVIVNIDPTTGRGLSPHKEKFYNYLGVIPIVHSNWKDVPESLKYLVWDEILHQKPRRRSCQQWRPDGGNLSPPSPLNLCMSIRKRAQEIQKCNDCAHVLSHGGYDLLVNKLLDEKRKRIQDEAILTENTPLIDDPPSPIERHEKWKLARTKRYGHMTSEAAQEIFDKIDSLQEQTTQGTFVPNGHDDILTTAIGRLKDGGRVRAAGSRVTISQYYGRASRGSSSSSTFVDQQ